MTLTQTAQEWATAHQQESDSFLEWLSSLSTDTTMADVWDICPKARWMLDILDTIPEYWDSYLLHDFAIEVAADALRTVGCKGQEYWDCLKIRRNWLAGDASRAEVLMAGEAVKAARIAAWDSLQIKNCNHDNFVSKENAKEASRSCGRYLTGAVAATAVNADADGSMIGDPTPSKTAWRRANLLRKIIANPFK